MEYWSIGIMENWTRLDHKLQMTKSKGQMTKARYQNGKWLMIKPKLQN